MSECVMLIASAKSQLKKYTISAEPESTRHPLTIKAPLKTKNYQNNTFCLPLISFYTKFTTSELKSK